MMTETDRHPTRRTVIRGAAWSTPVILAGAAAPAFAASANLFGVLFDGGGGANGFANSVSVNLGLSGTGSLPSSRPITVTFDVVGLNPNTTSERSLALSTSFGTATKGTYNPATRTTQVTWVIPAGTVFPQLSTAGNVPDILFRFGDGLASGQRITNKIVVTGISGGSIVQPGPPPIDSSVVKDYDRAAVSPDGIY